jgi:hypothetical protein
VVRPGILATNNHVLQDEFIDDLRVRFLSARNPIAKELKVKLLYRDRLRDLALLAVDSDRKPLALAAMREIPRGHPIAVVGHPSRFGGAVQELHAVSEGTVESLVLAKRHPWYHLKANAAPGNSGGPVVDRNTGEVIGILTFGLRNQLEKQGRPLTPAASKEPQDTFCIPVAALREAISAVEAARDRDKLSHQVTARYAAEMVTLHVCLAQLVSAQAAPAQVRVHLRRSSSRDVKLVDAYFDLHDLVMKRLKPAINHVRSTPDLSLSTKRTIARLLDNYQAIKRMVEKPRARTIEGYFKSYNALAKVHESCVKALFKDLGIPDQVEVKMLE